MAASLLQEATHGLLLCTQELLLCDSRSGLGCDFKVNEWDDSETLHYNELLIVLRKDIGEFEEIITESWGKSHPLSIFLILQASKIRR